MIGGPALNGVVKKPAMGQGREESWAAVSGDSPQGEPDKSGKDPPSRNPESCGEKSRVGRTAPVSITAHT